MVKSIDTASSGLATDIKDIDGLRRAARENSPEALKATAQQFEALFVNMVMKSMRDASPQDSVFNNEQSRMYQSMLDQQMSQNMAKRGIGLADVLVRQLSSTVARPPQDGLEMQGELDSGSGSVLEGAERIAKRIIAERDAARAEAANTKKDGGAIGSIDAKRRSGIVEGGAAFTPGITNANQYVRNASRPTHVREFADRVSAHAEEASRATGIPAKFMVAQAALESGWGRRVAKTADGQSSHNLFGIKATSGWKGKTVSAMTTEYIDGVPQKRIEKFRAYDSYADAFRDYARMLKNNPRYEKVLANAQDPAAFARGLQKAGYATDPLYAAKLTRLIKTTLSA